MAGGGVAVSGDEDGQGEFTMEGGTISGNTAAMGGGGVAAVNMGSSPSFSKAGGGTIYGDTDNTPGGNANTATSGSTGRGHAVFYIVEMDEQYNPVTSYYRDDTLNAGDNISTSNTAANWTKN
jgi:hypothetical protein